MRKSYVRLTAAALALALPLAMTSVAVAAPALKLPVRPAVPAKASASGLSVAVVPGAITLPATGFQDTLAAWTTQDAPESKVYSVSLQAGDVLHAVITQDVDADAFDPQLDCWAFEGDVIDIWAEDAIPVATSFGVQSQEIFVPATAGAGVYQLSLINWSEDTAATYTVDYEIVSGRTPATATRIPGSDRYAVAEAAARKAFPGWTGVTDVVIASGDDRAMADPLAASSLAGAYGAPLVLVKPLLVNSKLPAGTERVITEIKNANGGKVNIHVIGGDKTVIPAVYKRAAALRGSGTIERIAGADRYALSATIAKKARDVIVADGGTVTDVLIANGENPAAFYDALAISPIAYRNGMPMMLSRAAALPSSVKAQLNSTAFAGTTRYLVNAPEYLGDAVLDAANAEYNVAFSKDRYDAAWEIAEWGYLNGFLERDAVAVANKLPDALTGGVAMGQIGAPILYTPASSLSESTAMFLNSYRGAFSTAYVLGGTQSVTDATKSKINTELDW